MTYLDVSPMISALRVSPEHFEFTHGSLHHIPSRHRFHFHPDGVQIDALCDCSFLAVSPKQEETLREAFGEWRASYWRPAEINREFASHFEQYSPLRRLLIAMAGALHRALLRKGIVHHGHNHTLVPAE